MQADDDKLARPDRSHAAIALRARIIRSRNDDGLQRCSEDASTARSTQGDVEHFRERAHKMKISATSPDEKDAGRLANNKRAARQLFQSV